MGDDNDKSSIILIGMPGAGKSTIGVLLAKALALPFIDTDLLIQARVGMTLQSYLDTHGYLALRKVEEEVLLSEDLAHSVVATGGSVVYSASGMQRLGDLGIRIYLKISQETMVQRVQNAGQRGLACAPGTSMEALYAERCALYARYADETLVLDGLNLDESLAKVVALFAKWQAPTPRHS